jgi:hypothetical protein
VPTGCGKPIRLAELIEEVDNLPQPLQVQQGQIESPLSRGESLPLTGVGPAHGNGRVRAIGQAQDQVGINATADADNLTALAIQGMMGMGDGDRF